MFLSQNWDTSVISLVERLAGNVDAIFPQKSVPVRFFPLLAFENPGTLSYFYLFFEKNSHSSEEFREV